MLLESHGVSTGRLSREENGFAWRGTMVIAW